MPKKQISSEKISKPNGHFSQATVIEARGRIVCNCLNVAESEIVEALAARPSDAPEEALSGLQRTLRCGTSCGSCVPELKKIIAHASMSRAVTV